MLRACAPAPDRRAGQQPPGSAGRGHRQLGWMDNYMQLLLPFYTTTWRSAYLPVRARPDVHRAVVRRDQDVIYGWELGNELHTPVQPTALEPLCRRRQRAVRALDPVTPILPGTMGANHVEPGQPNSAIARWLYCEAPVDAYTLHAYDWVSRQRPGDMPIDWDLDNIVSQPCPNGRAAARVIVEELGTSRALPGVYTADDELAASQQELRQIAFVRQIPAGRGLRRVERREPAPGGPHVRRHAPWTDLVWRAAPGGGSCYDPRAGSRAGRALPARTGAARDALRARRREPIRGRASQGNARTDAVAGPGRSRLGWRSGRQHAHAQWLAGGPRRRRLHGRRRARRVPGQPIRATATRLTGAQLGLSRTDPASILANPDWTKPGFSINLPLDGLPGRADGPDAGRPHARSRHLAAPAWPSWCRAWARSRRCSGRRTRQPGAAAAPAPAFSAEVASPQPNDEVGRSFICRWSRTARTASTCSSSRIATVVGGWSARRRCRPGASASVARRGSADQSRRSTVTRCTCTSPRPRPASNRCCRCPSSFVQ